MGFKEISKYIIYTEENDKIVSGKAFLEHIAQQILDEKHR